MSEAEAVTELIVGDPRVSFNIQDLTGIEAFVNITLLDVHNNQLTSLNLSENEALEILMCYDNLLESIDVTQNTLLKELWCGGNQLESLDIRQNTQLNHLNINQNNITSIDLYQNRDLIGFACAFNQFSVLDLKNNTELEFFACQNNFLTSLDIRNGNNPNIISFYAQNNPDLTCIFVDNVEYSEANWTNVDPASTFVETQEECDALGVETVFLKKVKLFPNPVKNTLNIELPEQYPEELTIKIIDFTGKTIATHRLKANTALDVSYLPSGIYFINSYGNQNIQLTKKFVKL